MAGGFEALNEAGKLQASSAVMNYSLAGKATLTLDRDHWSTLVGHMVGSPVALPFVYTNTTSFGAFGSVYGDIIAIRSTTHPIAIYPIYIPAYGSDAMPYWNIMSATNGAQVTYYAFQKTSRIIPAEHGVGLEVYTGNTKTYYPPPDYSAVEYPEMSFSSLHKPIRFVSSHNVGLPGTSEVFVNAGVTGEFAAIVRSASITSLRSTSGVTPTITPGNILTGYPGGVNPSPNGRLLSIRMASNGFYYKGLDGVSYTQGNKSDGLVQLIDVAGY